MYNVVLKCRLMWVLWYYVSNLQSVSELHPQLQDILNCDFNFEIHIIVWGYKAFVEGEKK